MNKKGSMELSVNSIVILVIAIVMLGLILGFVKSKFSDLGNSLVKEEPDASPASLSDPITISRYTIVTGAGKSEGIKVNMYNSGSSTLTGAQPILSCSSTTNPVKITSSNPQFNARDIGVGNSSSYGGVITISSGATKGTYLCQFCMLNAASPAEGTLCTSNVIARKDFTIEID